MYDTEVVGMHFRGAHAKEFAIAVEEGTVLYLLREPANQYDDNAIMVWTQPVEEGREEESKGFHLGYIAGADAQFIAPDMDSGTVLTATVTGKRAQNNNVYPQVRVEPYTGDASFHQHSQDEADGFD